MATAQSGRRPIIASTSGQINRTATAANERAIQSQKLNPGFRSDVVDSKAIMSSVIYAIALLSTNPGPALRSRPRAWVHLDAP